LAISKKALGILRELESGVCRCDVTLMWFVNRVEGTIAASSTTVNFSGMFFLFFFEVLIHSLWMWYVFWAALREALSFACSIAGFPGVE
jgi:hypothetical protein